MALSQMIVPFIIAVTVTAFLTPFVRRFALQVGLVDMPNQRRINKVPMPTGGGLAIFIGFVAAALYGDIPHLLPTIIGGGIIVIVGLIDDRYELSPGGKFGGQFLGVLVYVLWGPRIEFLSNPFGDMVYLGRLSIPLTILWMLSVINIMNFIDGLDGLAVGITLIAAVALTSLAWSLERFDAAVMSVILVGVSVGFLPFNFNPAMLYLGDAGAMFLGFLLAAVSTEGALKGAATIGLSVPILILAVPVVDMVCAIVRRIQQGVPIYQADQDHFHHRLLHLGLSHRQVVYCAYLLSCFFAGVALLTAHFAQITVVVALILGMILLYGCSKVGMIKPLSIRTHGEYKDG